MIETNLQGIASMCGGELLPNQDEKLLIAGVSTDSRQIVQGGLFVPLVGDRFDGHAYVEQAIADGAHAALWQQDHPLPKTSLPLILVEDTLEALQQLASSYIRTLPVKVVAVTGSNGKTTTKDLIASVLSRTFRVHKTDGNFNNHIGLPLTVLRMPKDTDIAVLEMGMSSRGEIELLTKLVHPDVAVITNVGEAHLLQLGSREEIARAKMEIISGLKPDGILICHGDEPLLAQVFQEEQTEKPERMSVVTFGFGIQCDYRPEGIMQHEDGMSFTVANETLGTNVYSIPLLGKHNVLNSLAALAVGRLFRVPEPMISAAMSSASISGMRIEKTITKDGWILLNDAYNASPTAMKAALDVLASVRGGKRIAILGDMLELGPREEELHEEVGSGILPDTLDVLLTYGKLGASIAKGALHQLASEAVHSFQDKNELRDYLQSLVNPGDTVLLKASRGMKLEEIVEPWISTKH